MGFVKTIPANLKHGWNLSAEFGKRGEVVKFEAHHPNFGRLEFGLRPEGLEAVGWLWEEVGGGGSGVLPYTVIKGKLHIGVIMQNRPTMSTNQVPNMVRGFVPPGTTHLLGASQEAEEELGVKPDSFTLEPLGGEACNPNSTFFVTQNSGGFHFFAFWVSPELIIQNDSGFWEFVPGIFKPSNKMGEKITGCRFIPWTQAATLADGFTNSAVARLLASKTELIEYL